MKTCYCALACELVAKEFCEICEGQEERDILSHYQLYCSLPKTVRNTNSLSQELNKLAISLAEMSATLDSGPCIDFQGIDEDTIRLREQVGNKLGEILWDFSLAADTANYTLEDIVLKSINSVTRQLKEKR